MAHSFCFNGIQKKWRLATPSHVDLPRSVPSKFWELLDPANQRVARIHQELDGQRDGLWRWLILVDPHGSPLGETGYCCSESEARQICESKIPDWTIAHVPSGRKRHIQ